MMFGQDADLILWEPPDLEAGFSYSQRFGPIWSLPPVFIEVGGSVTITGHLAIGYDAQGLREVLFEGAGGASLLNGLFLGDLEDGVERIGARHLVEPEALVSDTADGAEPDIDHVMVEAYMEDKFSVLVRLLKETTQGTTLVFGGKVTSAAARRRQDRRWPKPLAP